VLDLGGVSSADILNVAGGRRLGGRTYGVVSVNLEFAVSSRGDSQGTFTLPFQFLLSMTGRRTSSSSSSSSSPRMTTMCFPSRTRMSMPDAMILYLDRSSTLRHGLCPHTQYFPPGYTTSMYKSVSKIHWNLTPLFFRLLRVDVFGFVIDGCSSALCIFNSTIGEVYGLIGRVRSILSGVSSLNPFSKRIL
jgi:hypothetical protein